MSEFDEYVKVHTREDGKAAISVSYAGDFVEFVATSSELDKSTARALVACVREFPFLLDTIEKISDMLARGESAEHIRLYIIVQVAAIALRNADVGGQPEELPDVFKDAIDDIMGGDDD